MTDNTVLISSVTITKLTVGNDVSIHMSTDPENLTIPEILDMIAVAQYATTINNAPYEQEDGLNDLRVLNAGVPLPDRMSGIDYIHECRSSTTRGMRRAPGDVFGDVAEVSGVPYDERNHL